jgi:hypothetical protein
MLMYQNNFTKIESIFSNPDNIFSSYSQHSYSALAHDHTSYSMNKWNGNYSSFINPICLYEINSYKQLESKPFYFVRDGLFLLMDFFNRVKKPASGKCILLVHHSLRNFIPSEWIDSILFYEYEYRPQFSKLKTTESFKKNKIIIKIDFMNKLFSVEKVLNLLKQYPGYDEILFCCSLHERNYFLEEKWDGGDFLFKTYETIDVLKKAALKICSTVELITTKELLLQQNLYGFEYSDASFKECYFIDDFVNFYCLQKGAIPKSCIEEKSASNKDLFVFLTFNHGIRILAKPGPIDQIVKQNFNLGFEQLGILQNQKLPISGFQHLESLSSEIIGSSWMKTFTHNELN